MATGTRFSAGPRRHGLWQVPMFVLGIVALAGAVTVSPPWRTLFAPERRLERALDQARQDLARPDADPAPVVSSLRLVSDQIDRIPGRHGECEFLLGTAYLFLAQRAGLPHYTDARRHLEAAQKQGVADDDRPRLLYRLGLVWHYTNEPPRRVIDALAATVETAADDPAEGYGILTKAYLSLPEPDVTAALEANARQLQAPCINEGLLAPARLLRGQLLLRIQRAPEAREVLKRIKPPAVPGLVAEARLLRARSFQDEQQWAEAAALWKEAAEQTPAAGNLPRLLYDVGTCYRNLDKLDEAEKVWEQAMALATGEEGPAAALALAELRLQRDAPAAALEAFGRAVHGVPAADAWKNSLVSLEKARQLFERAWQLLREAGRLDEAMQLARLYDRLAAAGTAQDLVARAAEELALQREQEAGKAGSAQAAKEKLEAAQALYRQAAAAYETSAERRSSPAEQAERFWHSGARYLQGQEHTRAIAVLERFLKVEQQPERVGEACFRLAEARRTLKQDDEALAAYAEAVKYRSPVEYDARYQLAALQLARGKVDEAKDILERNLQLLRGQPDNAAHENTLHVLGELAYERRDYALAADHLGELLTRYPNAAGALLARHHLAESYRQLALTEAKKLGERLSPEFLAHAQEQYRKYLLLAADQNQQLVATLTARPAEAALTANEEAILRQAWIALATCRSDLAQYDEAVQAFKSFVTRFQGRPASLHALSGIAACYWRQNQPDQARAVVQRIREALATTDFSQTDGWWSRAEWEAWLGQVSKP